MYEKIKRVLNLVLIESLKPMFFKKWRKQISERDLPSTKT